MLLYMNFGMTSYVETPTDVFLLKFIEEKAQTLEHDELKIINWRLLDRITRYEYETRKWYMIHEIQDIISFYLKELNPSISLKYVSTRFTNFPYISRFVISAWIKEEQWTAKNPVLSFTIPTWYCIEKTDWSLPDDFTKYSKNNWKTWDIRSEDLITSRTKFHPIACGVTHVKVIYPDDMSIFDIDEWYTAAMNLPLRPENNNFSFPFCVDILASADNVQYEQDRICVNRAPEERREVVWTFLN